MAIQAFGKNVSGSGVTYIQTSKPGYEQGSTWIDPDTGTYYAGYDAGGGGDYHPIPPIQMTEEISTFTENNITVTTDGFIDSGSVKTVGYFYLSESTFEKDYNFDGNVGQPRGIAWNGDGSKMIIADSDTSDIYSFNLSTNYDIGTASLNQSFDTSAQDFPATVELNGDGTKMYISNAQYIYSYNLSTAYDISTASHNNTLDLSSETSDIRGILFDSDGSKMYISEQTNDNVYSYNLSTQYDISTSSLNNTLDVSNEDTNPEGIAWNDDGSKLYLAGGFDDEMHSYDLTTAYDISTASVTTNTLDVTNTDNAVEGAVWRDNGTDLYVIGSENDKVYQYEQYISLPVTTTVEWDSGPSDIESWDLATYIADADGGSVTMDILDSQGNVLHSDVPENFDISTVSSSENLQIKITLNGTEQTNIPRLDYLARRFVR